jgi:hypothetical protein
MTVSNVAGEGRLAVCARASSAPLQNTLSPPNVADLTLIVLAGRPFGILIAASTIQLPKARPCHGLTSSIPCICKPGDQLVKSA